MTKVDSKSSAVWLMLAVVCAVRLIWHANEPIGIVGDEAYYWDWGRKLDWGYFSKPPGIAWLNRLVGELSGNSAFGIKACAAVLATAGVGFLYMAVKVWAGETIARFIALVAALSPGNWLLGSFLTTDAPLVFFWNLGMWLCARLIQQEQTKRADFFLLWLTLGVGSLFKQMMLMQILLLWITAFWMRRDLLKRWELSAASLGALLFLVPSLLWNVSNDWITAKHTAHHFQSAKAGIGAIFSRLGSLYGVTAMLVSPVAFMLCLMAAWRVTAAVRHLPASLRFFWLWGALPFAVCTLMIVRQEVNPNWPAVYIAPLVTMAALHFWEKKRLWKIAFIVAVSTTALIAILPFFMESFYRRGWIKPQLRGWVGYDELAKTVQEHRRKDEVIVVVAHRFSASHLAFHLSDQPTVYLWNDSGEVRSQYDLWTGPPENTNMLVVVEDGKSLETVRTPPAAFGEVEFVVSKALHPMRPEQQFHLYRAKPMSHWPKIGASPP
jgi:4-amino-4-deoxy-L-arabinose transferase-like glycosyltransferase